MRSWISTYIADISVYNVAAAKFCAVSNITNDPFHCVAGFLLPFLPPLVRAIGPGDVPAFGNTSASKIVCAFCVYAPGLYVALMAGYSQVAMWSYLR